MWSEITTKQLIYQWINKSGKNFFFEISHLQKKKIKKVAIFCKVKN